MYEETGDSARLTRTCSLSRTQMLGETGRTTVECAERAARTAKLGGDVPMGRTRARPRGNRPWAKRRRGRLTALVCLDADLDGVVHHALDGDKGAHRGVKTKGGVRGGEGAGGGVVREGGEREWAGGPRDWPPPGMRLYRRRKCWNRWRGRRQVAIWGLSEGAGGGATPRTKAGPPTFSFAFSPAPLPKSRSHAPTAQRVTPGPAGPRRGPARRLRLRHGLAIRQH